MKEKSLKTACKAVDAIDKATIGVGLAFRTALVGYGLLYLGFIVPSQLISAKYDPKVTSLRSKLAEPRLRGRYALTRF
ncbi:MAG: hypothetical protein ABIB71_01365 [Candidatus Woesearchaeota archaeon]